MLRPPPPIRDIRRLLAADPRRLEHGLRIALRHSAALHERTRELDLMIERGLDLLRFCGVRPTSWPPLDAPVRPPTLPEAMATVLQIHDNAWMRTPQLAHEIAYRGLYRRRDGLPATAGNVGARASGYPHLFDRRDFVIRLRVATAPTDDGSDLP